MRERKTKYREEFVQALACFLLVKVAGGGEMGSARSGGCRQRERQVPPLLQAANESKGDEDARRHAQKGRRSSGRSSTVQK